MGLWTRATTNHKVAQVAANSFIVISITCYLSLSLTVGLQPQVNSPWPSKCRGISPQQTLAVHAHESQLLHSFPVSNPEWWYWSAYWQLLLPEIMIKSSDANGFRPLVWLSRDDRYIMFKRCSLFHFFDLLKLLGARAIFTVSYTPVVSCWCSKRKLLS